MEISEIIIYWEETSDKDFITMNNLYKAGDYHWALFIGHLVLEKLLKACYVKHVDNAVPFTHDLLRLATAAKLEVDDEIANLLDLITTFNINTRYPDYKQEVYKKCTKTYALEKLNEIEGVREWLKVVISKKS